jgi:hypothetical protein
MPGAVLAGGCLCRAVGFELAEPPHGAGWEPIPYDEPPRYPEARRNR